MKNLHRCLAITALLTCNSALFGSTPAVEKPLPPLSIAERGEMVLEQDDVVYRPWSSEQNVGKVHVLQYFPGTMGDSKTFEPFTDRLQEEFASGTYHVTTIINLDAAMWGSTGFVIKEVEASKRKFPKSTMVLDEDGTGVSDWQLGKPGLGLAIVDPDGVVRFFTREPLSKEDIDAQVDLVRRYIEG